MPRTRGTLKALPISEADIEQTCTEYLQLDGWRALKTNPCSNRERGAGFGEKGMADYLYIRYGDGSSAGPLGPLWRSAAEVLWIEYKRPGGLLAPHQLRWHTVERERGAPVVTISSIDQFLSWYRGSGLNRGRV